MSSVIFLGTVSSFALINLHVHCCRPRDEYALLSVLNNITREIRRCVDAMVANVRERCARPGELSARQANSLRRAALLWPKLNGDLLDILERGVIELFARCQGGNSIGYFWPEKGTLYRPKVPFEKDTFINFLFWTFWVTFTTVVQFLIQ